MNPLPPLGAHVRSSANDRIRPDGVVIGHGVIETSLIPLNTASGLYPAIIVWLGDNSGEIEVWSQNYTVVEPERREHASVNAIKAAIHHGFRVRAHEDGDGCAIYDGSHVVQRDGKDALVSELEVGDEFTEQGNRWLVADTVQVGDDFHLDIEEAS